MKIVFRSLGVLVVDILTLWAVYHGSPAGRLTVDGLDLRAGLLNVKLPGIAATADAHKDLVEVDHGLWFRTEFDPGDGTFYNGEALKK